MPQKLFSSFSLLFILILYLIFQKNSNFLGLIVRVFGKFLENIWEKVLEKFLEKNFWKILKFEMP